MRLLVELTIRSSVILLVGLAASALLRGRSAALRHFVLATAMFAAAAVAPLSQILPAWNIPVPALMRDRPEVASDVRLAETTTPTGRQRAPRSATILPLAVIVWAAGVGVGATVLMTGLGRIRRIAARAERVCDGRWIRIADQVCGAYGLKHPVAILRTDTPALLATWGLFNARVLLPAHARDWSEDRVHVVLCHELAHILRHDWFVQISAEVLRTVYWFNPLLWIVCARLRRESEQACDDAVLHAGVRSREYAAHLLELAKICRRPGPTWASAMLMARPSTLERRIAAMLNPGVNRMALTRSAVATTAVMLLAITVPAAALRTAQDAPLPLVGSVYDASGAVLPQVELTLEDTQQLKFQAVTDATGRFEFPPVQPGRYVLEASLAGFRPLRQDFELRNARDWDRAITLQVGDVQETIMVRERRMAGPRPPSAQGPLPLKVGGNIRPPRKQIDVRPVYPPSMREAGREGVVPLEAIIGRDGTVHAVRVLSAQVHPDFAIAAIDAVRQWRFDSTLLNGVPVEVVMTVTVQFSLSE